MRYGGQFLCHDPEMEQVRLLREEKSWRIYPGIS